MHKSIQIGCVLSMACMTACSEPERPPPVPIEIPDALECIEDYADNDDRNPTSDIKNLWAAIDHGNPDAMLCSLGIGGGREETRDQIEMLYRWYRATGREPEGLGERIQGLNRSELGSLLRMAHEFNPELEPFKSDRRGCPIYDEIATELLLRVENGGWDQRCLPRRGWW